VGDREAAAPAAPEGAAKDRNAVVDVSGALGAAGHEVEEQGYEGVPDDGALLQEAGAAETHRDVVDTLDAIAEECPSD
jgi:hypothetical protein